MRRRRRTVLAVIGIVANLVGIAGLLLALGGCCCRESCAVRECCAPELPSANPVALLRAFHPVTGDHLYMTDEAELKDVVSRLGYVAEGTSVEIYATQTSGTVPLWRLWLPATNDHFYTTDTDERAHAIRDIGYRSEGVAGYVFAESRPGTVPLFRSFQRQSGDHFYTANALEHVTAVHDLGFVDEGIACDALPHPPSAAAIDNISSTLPFGHSDVRKPDADSRSEELYVIVHSGLTVNGGLEERRFLADLDAVLEGQLSLYIAVPKSNAREAIRRILASRFRDRGNVMKLESIGDN